MDYRQFKDQFKAENPGLGPGERNYRCRKAWEAQATPDEKRAEAKRQKEVAQAKEASREA